MSVRFSLEPFSEVFRVRIGGLKSNIEIVRQVPGASSHGLDALAVQAEWAGRQIRVLDPSSLLVGKLELALTLPQQHRRDGEHVGILVHCVRGFLREFRAGVHSGELPAKGWLGAVNQLLKLSKSARGRKAVTRFGINWIETLPLPEIKQSQQTKMVAFREKQLSRWLPT